MSDEDDLFTRWARRKRRVAEVEAEAEKESPTPAEADANPEAEPEGPEKEAALLEKLGLPLPESLGKGDDFTVFMKPGVPGFLRKRALRVLWSSNPVLANLDGLNDYDDDFTSPELTQKVLATAYKVGRGLLSDPGEKPAVTKPVPAEDEARSIEAGDEAAALGPSETSELPSPQADEDVVGLSDDAQDEIPAKPRRMRFEVKA